MDDTKTTIAIFTGDAWRGRAKSHADDIWPDRFRLLPQNKNRHRLLNGSWSGLPTPRPLAILAAHEIRIGHHHDRDMRNYLAGLPT